LSSDTSTEQQGQQIPNGRRRLTEKLEPFQLETNFGIWYPGQLLKLNTLKLTLNYLSPENTTMKDESECQERDNDE